MMIIGIIFAVALPKFQAAINKANVTRQVIEDKADELEKDLDEMRRKGETIFE